MYRFVIVGLLSVLCDSCGKRKGSKPDKLSQGRKHFLIELLFDMTEGSLFHQLKVRNQ